MLATAAGVLRESYANVRLTARTTCRPKAKVRSPVAVVAPALGRWVSLANLLSKAARTAPFRAVAGRAATTLSSKVIAIPHSGYYNSLAGRR
jgi:hypothetical protein